MKLDSNLIEGFSNMTDEQKVQALLNLDMDPTKAGFVTKENFDKVMKEAGDNRKKLKDQESAGKAENDKLAETIENLQKQVNTLNREKHVADMTAKFLGLGYSKELAAEAAVASADADNEKLFSVQQKFIEEHDKAVKAEALKNMGDLQGGKGGKGGSEGGQDNANIELAKSLGKATASSVEAANSVLGHYLMK